MALMWALRLLENQPLVNFEMKPQRDQTPRNTVNSQRITPEALREEKMKARALMRWENEGGKILRRSKDAEDSRKKHPR